MVMKMKKVIWIVLVGLLGIFTYFWLHNEKALPTSTAERSLSGFVVTIDPGHGGLDNGASIGKTKEDELNLKISLALQTELEARGATVYLTRVDDQDMTQRNHHYSKQDDMYLRALKIDENEPDVFVSIHLNSTSSSSAWGSQVFYYQNSAKAKQLATAVHQAMKPVTGTKKRIQSADFYVLRCTKTVGVLIECGFISNPNECGQLRSSKYHQKLAVAISNGISDYLLAQ